MEHKNHNRDSIDIGDIHKKIPLSFLKDPQKILRLIAMKRIKCNEDISEEMGPLEEPYQITKYRNHAFLSRLNFLYSRLEEICKLPLENEKSRFLGIILLRKKMKAKESHKKKNLKLLEEVLTLRLLNDEYYRKQFNYNTDKINCNKVIGHFSKTVGTALDYVRHALLENKFSSYDAIIFCGSLQPQLREYTTGYYGIVWVELMLDTIFQIHMREVLAKNYFSFTFMLFLMQKAFSWWNKPGNENCIEYVRTTFYGEKTYHQINQLIQLIFSDAYGYTINAHYNSYQKWIEICGACNKQNNEFEGKVIALQWYCGSCQNSVQNECRTEGCKHKVSWQKYCVFCNDIAIFNLYT